MEHGTLTTDQWALLAQIDRLSSLTVGSILARAAKEDGIIGVRSVTISDDVADDPWTLPPSKRESEPRLTGPFPSAVKVVSANMLFIDKASLPERLTNRLSRLAAFQNPEFYQAQSLRFSTFGKPRIIACAEDFPKHLAIPRGCADEVLGLLKECGIKPEVQDSRYLGVQINTPFQGVLRPDNLGPSSMSWLMTSASCPRQLRSARLSQQPQ